MSSNKKLLVLIVLGIMASWLGAPTSAIAAPPEAFTIHGDIDFTGLCVGEPIEGSVVAGSDLCVDGSYVDRTVGISGGALKPTNPSVIGIAGVIERLYTCPATDDRAAGTIKMRLNPMTFDPDESCENSPDVINHDHFVIVSGTGGYEGIHGRGDWSVTAHGCFIPCVLESGTETLTGVVQFDSH